MKLKLKLKLKLKVFAFGVLLVLSGVCAATNEKCYMQPETENGVCINLVDSKIAMLVDYQIFKIVDGEKTLLVEKTNEISVPAGIVYSEKGGYLAEIYSEEGHPYFVFFDSQSYFYEKEPKHFGFLEDYYLGKIESFSEDGVFTYSLWKEDCTNKKEPGCLINFRLKESIIK